MVNILLILAIAFLVVIYITYKWNNMRTKIAFFFILFGVLFVFLFVFLVATGSSFNFESIGKAASSVRPYFLSIKGAVINVFEATGRAIGLID